MPHGSGHAHARVERVVAPTVGARAQRGRQRRARDTAITPVSPSRVPVAQPNDAVELEADRIADLIGPRAVVAHSSSQSPLACAPSSVWKAVDSPGRPLTEYERPAAIGIDFSHVRVHTGRRASESARELAAAAYTLGNDIVLADAYDPGTTFGRRLLAHELA